MFGYVKPFKDQLKVCEYETYKAAYCTLCKRMGKKYGHIARMTLSYDFTFLAVMMLALDQTDPQYKRKGCVYNPFKKCVYITDKDDIFDLVSAAAVSCVYAKIVDNIEDSKGLKKFGYRIFKAIFSRKYEKSVKLFPDIAKTMLDMVNYQIKIEKKENIGIDEAAEPTATAMKRLFSLCTDDEVQGRILAQIGYCIGKWIYLIDAVEDIDEDIKSGNFNPLKSSSVESAVMTMNVCAAEAGNALELLEIKRFGGILRNIIYIGLIETGEKAVCGRKEAKK